MTSPDLITVWPENLDYPPFRLFIRAYRMLLGKVIIVWTEAPDGKMNFRKEVEELMKDDLVIFRDSKCPSGEDWRNVATNIGLQEADADWVLFMEQDFLILNGEKLIKILNSRKGRDVIGFYQNGRLHPAFLLVRKSKIDQTSKDFSAKPEEGYDHFGKFTQELNCPIKTLDELKIVKGEGYKHMNGLSHNINLCERGTPKDLYMKEEFDWYLRNSLNDMGLIKISDNYRKLVGTCLKELENAWRIE